MQAIKPQSYLVPLAAIAIAVAGFGRIDVAGAATMSGVSGKLGTGTVQAFAEFEADGVPAAIGVAFGHDLFAGLPAERNLTSRCFDLDGNGKIDDGECEGDLEIRLALPNRPDLPFKWVGMNWNAEGHPPPGVYDPPHFDFHFYMVDRAAIDGIRVGKCGFYIHCDDFKRATKPVPRKYVHPEHINVGAAVSKMGNHLIDSLAPEFRDPPVRFTHTFIFGAYDGHITFYEPMITRAFLVSRPDTCTPIKQPEAWKVAGYYPTTYCIRYLPARDGYTVSLEGFVRRAAE